MFTTVIFKWSLLHPTSNVPRTHFLVLSLLLFLCSPTWHHVSFVTCSEDRTFPFDAFPYLLCWRSTKPTHQCPDISFTANPESCFPSCHSSDVLSIASLLGYWTQTFSRTPCLHTPFTFHPTQRIPFPQTHSCFWKSDCFLIGNQEPKKQTKTLSSWSPVVIVCELSCS